MVIVTKTELSRLGSAAYQATDKSIAGPLMQKYWTWAMRFIPMRMHPNVVTYTGFLWLLSAVAIVFYYDFSHTYAFGANDTAQSAAVEQRSSTTAPQWVWIWAAVAIFMYQTFDALDGKQARRIKAGSAVGEIVDHSADAVTTIFVQYLLTSAIFRDDVVRGFVLTLMVFIGFFVSHWECYVTHVFYLGYINGPTEGLLLTASLFIITGVFGADVWGSAAYYFLPNVKIAAPSDSFLTRHFPAGLTHFTLEKNADLIFYLTFAMAFFTVAPSIVLTAYTAIGKSYFNSSSPIRREPATHPPVRVYEALARTLMPFLYLAVLACDYVYKFSAFHKGNFFLPEVALGWVASLAATRVTVRRLTGAAYGFCTVSFFAAFVGYMLPLMALKGLRVFGDGMTDAELTAATSHSIVGVLTPSVLLSLSPQTIMARVFLSSELQWFNSDANQRWMWIAICAMGCCDYIYYCWRLLWLMAKHLRINLLVLTPAQLAFVDQLEKEMNAKKSQ